MEAVRLVGPSAPATKPRRRANAAEVSLSGSMQARTQRTQQRDAALLVLQVVGAIDFNNLTGFLNEPRTWGVEFTAKF